MRSASQPRKRLTSSLSPWKPPVASSTARASIVLRRPRRRPSTRTAVERTGVFARSVSAAGRRSSRCPVRVQRVDVGAVGDAEAHLLRTSARSPARPRRGPRRRPARSPRRAAARAPGRRRAPASASSRRRARSTGSRPRSAPSRRTGRSSRTRRRAGRAPPRAAAAARPGLPSAHDDQIDHRALPRNVTVVASLSDISRHAGVSIATCSRVLNGSTHPVSEETRTRVLQRRQGARVRAERARPRARDAQQPDHRRDRRPTSSTPTSPRSRAASRRSPPAWAT